MSPVIQVPGITGYSGLVRGSLVRDVRGMKRSRRRTPQLQNRLEPPESAPDDDR